MKLRELTKWVGASAVVLVSGAAQAINVGGVEWDPDNVDDFFATDTMYEQIGTFTGQTLDSTTAGIDTYNLTGTNTFSLYGKVVNINGDTTGFCSGCELTYQLTGLSLNQYVDVNDNQVADNGDHLSLTGGLLNFYVDTSPDFAVDDYASAGDGGGANALWLSLAGTSQTATIAGLYPLTGTIFSTLNEGSLGSGTEGGNGFGNFDVTGGLAAVNFDTNGEAGGSDFRFTSSFGPRNCALNNPVNCGSDFLLVGSNELLGKSVPTPGTLLLLGLGLAALGSRKVAKR